MITPVILYTTAGMPIGPRAIITFYRPPVTNDTNGNSIASVVPYGSEANGTNLGSFVVEGLTLETAGKLYSRMGIYTEERDKALVRKDPTLSMTVQQASAGTPSLMPGDYCAISIGMKASSTAAAPAPVATSRWFLDANSLQYTDINKFGLKLQLDRENSATTLIEF